MRDVLQLVKLSNCTFKRPAGRNMMIIRRGLLLGNMRRKWETTSKRNLLVIRFSSKDNTKHYNLASRSAGMGGPHPMRTYNESQERTASHTEPQIAGLLQNKSFTDHLKKKLGSDWYVEFIFSSNKPCSSKNGGTSNGCKEMGVEEFHNPKQFFSHSIDDYKGGAGPDFKTVYNALKNKCELEINAESEDEALEEDRIRGSNLSTEEYRSLIARLPYIKEEIMNKKINDDSIIVKKWKRKRKGKGKVSKK